MPIWLAIIIGILGLGGSFGAIANWALGARNSTVRTLREELLDAQGQILDLQKARKGDQEQIGDLSTQVDEWKTRYGQLNTEWQLKYDDLRRQLELMRQRQGVRSKKAPVPAA